MIGVPSSPPLNTSVTATVGIPAHIMSGHSGEIVVVKGALWCKVHTITSASPASAVAFSSLNIVVIHSSLTRIMCAEVIVDERTVSAFGVLTDNADAALNMAHT